MKKGKKEEKENKDEKKEGEDGREKEGGKRARLFGLQLGIQLWTANEGPVGRINILRCVERKRRNFKSRFKCSAA